MFLLGFTPYIKDPKAGTFPSCGVESGLKALVECTPSGIVRSVSMARASDLTFAIRRG